MLVFRKIKPCSQGSIGPPNMDRHLSLQTYVPRPLADWIKRKARDQQVSVSIVIRDQLIDAWPREYEARKLPAALAPLRQNLFITFFIVRSSCWSCFCPSFYFSVFSFSLIKYFF